jgi:hypothetical protein
VAKHLVLLSKLKNFAYHGYVSNEIFACGTKSLMRGLMFEGLMFESIHIL